jgi:hypothetical protein
MIKSLEDIKKAAAQAAGVNYVRLKDLADDKLKPIPWYWVEEVEEKPSND